MPTELGTRWPTDVSRRPTRMSPEDYLIWQRWWPTKKHLAKAVYFDVYLGTGIELEDMPENYRRMWTRNTQKRADVIIDAQDGIWIVELRTEANSNALGRLQMYNKLWADDPGLPGRVSLYLITNNRDPDLTVLTRQLGIIYEVS